MTIRNGGGTAHRCDSEGASKTVDSTDNLNNGSCKPNSSKKQRRLTAEEAIIALIAKDLRLAKIAAEQTKLGSQHFADPVHRKWFTGMLQAAANGHRATDLEKLRRSPQKEWHYIADLIERAPPTNSDRHAENLVRMFARQIIAAHAKRGNGKAEPTGTAGKNLGKFRLTWIVTVGRDRELTAYAKAVAVAVVSFVNKRSGDTFAAQTTIAETANVSRRAAQNALVELVNRHYLTISPGSRGPGGSNRYALALPGGEPEPDAPPDEPEQQEQPAAVKPKKPPEECDDEIPF